MDDELTDTMISGQHEIQFGKHKGKTIRQVSESDPFYVLWLSGVVSKFSVQEHIKKIYDHLIETQSETIHQAKVFARDKCKSCLGACKHACIKVSKGRNYHYHPYGKRD